MSVMVPKLVLILIVVILIVASIHDSNKKGRYKDDE